MLRPCLTFVTAVLLSTASQAATPASLFCSGASPGFDYLQFDQAACQAAAAQYPSLDGAAVKGMCTNMASFYAPAWQAADVAAELAIACFKAVTPQIASPKATAALQEEMCNAFPSPAAGVGSAVEACKAIATGSAAAGASSSQMLTASCTGVTSMFDRIEAVSRCFSQGIDALGL